MEALSIKKSVIAVCFSIILLAAGLCVVTYQTTKSVSEGFTRFTTEDLVLLERLFNIRAYFSEYERLLYEYYATLDRREILKQIATTSRLLNSDLDSPELQNIDQQLMSDLSASYAGLIAGKEQLDAVLSSDRIDWDAARKILSDLTGHGNQARPIFQVMFREIEKENTLSSRVMAKQLDDVTIMVTVFVVIMLLISVVTAYFVREMVISDKERKRLAYFPERNPDAVFGLDINGCIEYENPAARHMCEEAGGNLKTILPDNFSDIVQGMKADGRQTLRFDYTLNDRIYYAELKYLADLRIFHMYVTDITEKRKAENELIYLAYHDPVSNLPNIRSFIRVCKSKIKNNPATGFCVFTVGFSRFEQSVRSLGIDTVDELIKIIGTRLSELFKYRLITDAEEFETEIFRSSGVSFTLLISGNRDHSPDKYNKIASMLIDVLSSEPVNVQRREIWLRPIIGISYYPEDNNIPSLLLSGANAAIASIEKKGHEGFQRVSPDIITAEETWHKIESDLRQGLVAREGLSIFYQPKICSMSGRMAGVEALLRWKNNNGQILSPAELVPVAEESGLIIPIGKWILEDTCRQADIWINRKGMDMTVAINISQLQLQQDDFPEHLQDSLMKYNISPCCINLEITESMLMQEPERCLEIMHQMRKYGYSLSLDDFGTGYSSLEYLHSFPISHVKIDKSFVKKMSDNKKNRIIIRNIVNLAHELDISVVAEGVETREQAACLVDYGCDELQGYFYSKPLDCEYFESWYSGFEGIEHRQQG